MNDKLRIGIISCDYDRGRRVFESVIEKETDKIQSINKAAGMIETENAVYRVMLGTIGKIEGYKADQLIFDTSLYPTHTDIINRVLMQSTIPVEWQIIDDREILR